MMRFAEPELLWGLVLLPLVALAVVLLERRRRRDLARVVDTGTWIRMLPSASPERRRLATALALLASVFLLIGASRPQLGSRILETRQRGGDIVLAVDLSLSMEARDIAPSRRERARQEVLSLLDQLEGDRVALVSFAGEAFIQSPLTLDRGAVRMLLPLLDPSSMPEPGTNLAAAIRRGIEAFQDDPRRGRAIVLFSDGEAWDGDLERAVAEAKDARVRVCAVGIGRTQGDPIPLPGRTGQPPQYKKDRAGRVVVTRLEEEGLRRACEATGGAYVRSEGGMAAPRIVRALRDLEQTELEGGLGLRYEERFAYFAAVALGLLLAGNWLAERRRVG